MDQVETENGKLDAAVLAAIRAGATRAAVIEARLVNDGTIQVQARSGHEAMVAKYRAASS